MGVIAFFSALCKVWNEVRVQRRFQQQYLIPYMQQLERQYGGTFPEAQRKKILHYYGLFIPSVLCASYVRLYGRTLTRAERERVSLFGILTPVGDDLFDIDKLDVECIRTITYTPEHFTANSFSSAVAKQIQQYLLDHVPHRQAYLTASKDVFEVQLETIRQTNPAITEADIADITWKKGGYSVIIYHQTLDETAAPAMRNALFHIGSLMQFANDCFDIYKDIHDGIFTLASRCDDYRHIKSIYLNRVREANRLVRALPYTRFKKMEFLVIMHVIIAQGLVAIDQMIRLQDALGKPVDCLQQPRKALITDMQKVRNVLRWMYYAIKLPGMR